MRTWALVTVTAMLAGGDAEQAGRAHDLSELLGPAGSTIIGAATVWAYLQRWLQAAEKTATAAAEAAQAVARKLEETERAHATRLAAAEKDIERWRRATRSAEAHLDQIRQSLRTLLLLAKAENGKPNEALMAEISGMFDRPSSRIREDSA